MLGPFYSGEVLPPFLAEQASQTCRASLSDLLSKSLRLAGQASHACRTSFLKRDGQVWAFVLTGGPRERMGPTFFGRVDMGILGSPMGPLGLPDLISQFTLFTMYTISTKKQVAPQLAFPLLSKIEYDFAYIEQKKSFVRLKLNKRKCKIQKPSPRLFSNCPNGRTFNLLYFLESQGSTSELSCILSLIS